MCKLMNNFGYRCILLSLAFLTISCTNPTKPQKQQDDIEMSNSIINDANSILDSLQILQDSIPDKQQEEPDSLDGWIEISSLFGIYYKDVMLTMPIVDIVNPQLKMYLSDYIIPLVKSKGFDIKENFIFISYITDKQALSEGETARIEILVDYCGMSHEIARDIYDNKYKVTFIDEIPIMLENFNKKGFIKDTTRVFEFGRWKKSFEWLKICDNQAKFYFSELDGNIYYNGYEEWGLHLVYPNSKLPEVWNPEQREQDANMPSDSLLEEAVVREHAEEA